MGKGIGPGAIVIVTLHSPREKWFGSLDQISSAGVFLRGINLHSFDDWVSASVAESPFVGLSDLFFPMWRVERLIRDERDGEIPSLTEQFQSRTGRLIDDFLNF
jgi:hypothetical protein